MPREPRLSQPRHRLPVVKPRERTVAEEDTLIDQVGKGDYTGSDPLGRILAVYRDQVLKGERPARAESQRLGLLRELIGALAAASCMATLLGVAVILTASATVGIMLIAMAVSWAAVMAAMTAILRSQR